MFRKQRNFDDAGADGHETYREFCALASSGALSDREWSSLSSHLQECAECRVELAKYQEIATFGISLVSPTDASLDVENEWSPETAVAKLMNRLQEQSDDSREALPASHIVNVRHWPFVSFRSAALPYAAAIIVFAAATASFYVAGVRAGVRRTNSHPQQLAQPDSSLEALVRERAQLQNELQSRSTSMERISEQLQEARAALDAAEVQKRVSEEKIDQLQLQTHAQQAGYTALRAQYQNIQRERLAVEAKLQQAETNLAAVQRNFDLLSDQHASDVARIAKLEVQTENVSHQPQPAAYIEAQQLSTAEPELSDLMGARDLFIADVYDIDKTGLPQKPFGRIFYTRGRRLLFYAFDLDRAQGVKSASTFQVWGRRGYGDTRPLNMGVMYLDSKATQRWALKFEDAKALSQVDAVFVTIEPRGGSNAPKGRQLLYASLKTPPNHP